MNTTLENSSVIVTGASSGIGWAIAQAVYKQGARVMLHGRNAKSLAEKADFLGSNARWVVADLADLAASDIVAQASLDAFGSIDGLVNNAGVFPRSDIDTEVNTQFDKVFHINARAPLMLAQRLVQDCRARKAPGAIVNIGSINAYCGADMILIYSMSKGALMTMTRNLGDALGEDLIRVNQLNVGWTLTQGEIDMQKSMGAPDDWHENINKAAAPRGSLLTPEEIANHAVFWLSPASAPVTGSVYEVEQYPVIGRNKVAG
ncbi:MAG: SDR family oxidoreductase [Robiginitomaculum sp.]|nr:SDR family oxidoreductase [Robiginitomaculum sp.]